VSDHLLEVVTPHRAAQEGFGLAHLDLSGFLHSALHFFRLLIQAPEYLLDRVIRLGHSLQFLTDAVSLEIHISKCTTIFIVEVCVLEALSANVDHEDRKLLHVFHSTFPVGFVLREQRVGHELYWEVCSVRGDRQSSGSCAALHSQERVAQLQPEVLAVFEVDQDVFRFKVSLSILVFVEGLEG